MTNRRFIFHISILLVLVVGSSAIPTQQAKSLAVNQRVACGNLSFGAATNFAVFPDPHSVAMGNFNGDSFQDLVTANRSSDTVSTLSGTGTGNFGPASNAATGDNPHSVAVGNFNGDGFQDLVVANTTSASVSILLGTGLGTFSGLTNFAVAPALAPVSVAVGDFNSDGRQDLATANIFTHNVSILLGNGNGTFGTATNFSVGTNPTFVAVGDFNGDGRQDLATANNGSDNISVILGNGAGGFGSATPFAVGIDPISVIAGDLNGDGIQDLTATNYLSNTVSVLLGTGTGSFGTASSFAVGSNPYGIARGDFNGDGVQDLAVTNVGSGSVSILLGNGNGTFGTAVNFSVGASPVSVVVSDFNGDGKQDLAVANNASNNVSILLNTCDATFPTVTSTSLSSYYKTRQGPSNFTVTFSEDVSNPAGNTDPDDVTTPANYLLVEYGTNAKVDTVSCAGGVAGDDYKVTISGVTYANPTATVTLPSALGDGGYRLFVCGTTSIIDLGTNPLGGGVDYTFNFIVGDTGLPQTGFAPSRVTSLPQQPAHLAYVNMSDIWLEIPSLNVKTNIVGVPKADNNWDVTWLGRDAGWLNGTAFPSWEGNSVVTAHVTDANGKPGPFATIKDMKYGDKIIVHMYGEKYIFEVQATRMVKPSSTQYAFKDLEDYAYLTLITCQGYDSSSESYLYRRVVRAILVDVQSE